MRLAVFAVLLCSSLLSGCDPQVPASSAAAEGGFSAPTSATLAAQADTAKSLPAEDALDQQEAERGLIAREPSLQVKMADGRVIFDQDAYGFIQGAAPGSVNPSLWRQAKLNNSNGLYKVADGV